MPTKYKSTERFLKPDPRFKNKVVSKFINCMMYGGKKSIAQNILYDALDDMMPSEKLKGYIEKRTVEIVPLAYMRGRTLNNAFVILDEAQNATDTQMKMFLTRLGANSKAIITGDITQIDLPGKSVSGLIQAKEILSNIEGVGFVYFDKSDVVRHKLVKDIIDAYEKFNNSND